MNNHVACQPCGRCRRAGKLSSQPEGMPQSWGRATGTGNRATSRTDGTGIEGGATTGRRPRRPRKRRLRAAAPHPAAYVLRQAPPWAPRPWVIRVPLAMARTLEERSSGFHDPLSDTLLKTASCHQSKGRLGPGVFRVRNPAATLRPRPDKNGTRSRSSLIFQLCEPTGVKGVLPEAIQRCRFFGRAGGHPGSRSNRWPGRAGLRPGLRRPPVPSHRPGREACRRAMNGMATWIRNWSASLAQCSVRASG